MPNNFSKKKCLKDNFTFGDWTAKQNGTPLPKDDSSSSCGSGNQNWSLRFQKSASFCRVCVTRFVPVPAAPWRKKYDKLLSRQSARIFRIVWRATCSWLSFVVVLWKQYASAVLRIVHNLGRDSTSDTIGKWVAADRLKASITQTKRSRELPHWDVGWKLRREGSESTLSSATSLRILSHWDSHLGLVVRVISVIGSGFRMKTFADCCKLSAFSWINASSPDDKSEPFNSSAESKFIQS